MSSLGRRVPASARTGSAPAVVRHTRYCHRCQPRKSRGASPRPWHATSAPSTSPGFRIAPVSRPTGSPAGRSAGFCDGGQGVPKPDRGALSFRHGAKEASHGLGVLSRINQRRGQRAPAFHLHQGVAVNAEHLDADILSPGPPAEGEDRLEAARLLVSRAYAGADGHERLLGASKGVRQLVVEMDLAFSFRTRDYRRLAAPSPVAPRAFSISSAPIPTPASVAKSTALRLTPPPPHFPT